MGSPLHASAPMSSQNLTLGRVAWLVLDEADRLLDMGFEKTVTEIVRRLDSMRQVQRTTGLFSATLTVGIERLAHLSLQKAVSVTVEKQEQGGLDTLRHSSDKDVVGPPGSLRQRFLEVCLNFCHRLNLTLKILC